MPALPATALRRFIISIICLLTWLIVIAQGKRINFERKVTVNSLANERIASIRIGNMYDELRYDLSNHHIKSRTITYDYNHPLVDKTEQRIMYDAFNNPAYILSTTINNSGVVVEGSEELWNNNDLLEGYQWGNYTGKQWASLYNNNKDAYANVEMTGTWQPRIQYTVPVGLQVQQTEHQQWDILINQIRKGSAPVSTPNSTYGQGGRTDWTFDDRGNFKISEKKIYDANGVLREYHYVEHYPDDYSHEEITYYDCYGVPVFFKATLWDDYEEEEINVLELIFQNGQPVAGIKDVDDYDDSFRQYFNPATGQFEFLEYGERQYEDYFFDLKEQHEPCDEPKNFLTIGPRLLLEDSYPDRFSMLGGFIQYTHMFNSYIGATVDLGYTTGEQFEWQYSRFNIVAGINYYPFDCAEESDNYSLSAHVLAGISNVKGKYEMGSSTFENSSSDFTLYGGIDGSYYFNDKLGVKLQADFNPIFTEGNTTKNWIISAGLKYRF